MLDLIKTFILGIWIEKKYRYFFLFIFITLIYRLYSWVSVIMLQEISPVEFVKIEKDGALTFVYKKKYEQTIYPNDFQLPSKNGHKNPNYDVKDIKDTKKCEKDFFVLYQKATMDILKSSADNKYIIKFGNKFPKKIGEITYYDSDNIETSVFQKLYHQGFIFNQEKDVDYCEELKKITKTQNTKN